MDTHTRDRIILSMINEKHNISHLKCYMPTINFLLENHGLLTKMVTELKEVAQLGFQEFADDSRDIFENKNYTDLKEHHIFKATKYAEDIFSDYVLKIDKYHKENILNWKSNGLINNSTNLPIGFYGEEESTLKEEE